MRETAYHGCVWDMKCNDANFCCQNSMIIPVQKHNFNEHTASTAAILG